MPHPYDPNLHMEYSVELGEMIRGEAGTMNAVVVVRLHGAVHFTTSIEDPFRFKRHTLREEVLRIYAERTRESG